MSRTCKYFVSIAVTSFATVLMSGCFTSHPKNIAAFYKPSEVDVTSKKYVLMPPDRVTIHCSRVPELDGQGQTIRPDGIISFESLGEIYVAGKTPEEVTVILEQKAASLYNLPGDEPIDVRLAAYQSKRYYVLGQVFRPGPAVYTGRDSVLQALAGRLNPMAWKSRIQVIRPSAEQDVPPEIFEINYTWMAKHGDLRKNVLLEEGDIIYVPATPFAAVAMTMEQVLRPISRAIWGSYLIDQVGSSDPYGGRNSGGGGGGF